MITAYPLYWPDGWKRTERWDKQNSKFRSSFAVARDELLQEIARLQGRLFHGSEPILSTNVALRQDGLPMANQRDPNDSGVAVYFEYRKKPMVFACDKYDRVWENMVAIRKTIEAIRGMERWGASDMMERAFQGFTALEHSKPKTWREVLFPNGCPSVVSIATVKTHYRQLAWTAHPDRGGSNEAMAELNVALEQAENELAP